MVSIFTSTVLLRITKKSAIAAVLCSATAFAQSDIVPADRRVPWIPGLTVGVPGGIPTNRVNTIDVTQQPYNADKTGAADASPAIQAAINAAQPGQVVYLPAGRYRLNSTLSLHQSRDMITLRGAGMAATVLDCRMTNVAVYVGSGSDYLWGNPASNNIVSTSRSKGNGVLNIGDTSPFAVGSIVTLSIQNQTDDEAIRQGATPHVSIAGYDDLRRQMARVVSKTSNSLTITPALYDSYTGVRVKVNVATFQTDLAGVEDLTIDCTNGNTPFGVQMEQAYGCWIKNVKVTKAANYAFFIASAVNCEVRHSFADQRSSNGTNGAGILFGMASGCLVEDNILYKFFPLIEVSGGASGNVFAYNFCYDSSIYGGSGSGIFTNHAPHNMFNLYEGNMASTLQSDGYFGGASDDTIFRNWLHGTNPNTPGSDHSVVLNRFTRNYNIVGNILGKTATSAGYVSYGNPNMGNGAFIGSANPKAGSFWNDWKMKATITSKTSDESGTLTLSSGSLTTAQYITITWGDGLRRQFYPSTIAGNLITFSGGAGSPVPAPGTLVSVWTGSGGYQERDLGVEPTTVRLGNYNAADGRIPTGEVLSIPLPNSLYLNSKPSWFGTLTWPAFEPSNPNQSMEAIPAAYRYFHGGETPGILSETTAQAPSNARVIRLAN